MPLFSIIIPVYNVEKYLNKCVDSVLNQTFTDFEVILVDDGSPDNCPAICDSYAEKDKRVRVIHKQNGGASSARNIGLDRHNGRYIIFMDADDYWDDSEALKQLYTKSQEKYDIIMFGCTICNITNNKKKISRNGYNIELLENSSKDEVIHYLLSKKMIPGGPVIFAFLGDIVKQHHIRFKEGIAAEDYDFIISLLFNCNKFSAINNPFYIYRKGRKNSVTSSSFGKILDGTVFTIDKWYRESQKIDNSQIKKDLLNYLAFIFSTALVILGKMNKNSRKKYLEILNKYKLILNYAYWKKTKIIKLSVFILGISKTVELIKICLKH